VFSWALVAWLVIASLMYVVWDILIVHQGTFSVVCGMVAFKIRALMKERVHDPATRNRLRAVARVGTGMRRFSLSRCRCR
jgi:hypothetical protein